MPRFFRGRVPAALLTLLLCGLCATGGATTLDTQRAQFRAAMAALQRGNAAPLTGHRDSLRDYPLFPYLELRELESRLGSLPFDDVDAFLARYGADLPAVMLRETWLRTLASRDRWADYVRYDTSDAVTDVTRRCTRAWALMQSGDRSRADRETAEIWSTPRSLPAQCDALFQAWYRRGNPAAELAWQRFLQASAGDARFATYLTRFLAPAQQRDASLLAQLRDHPALVTETARFQRDNPRHAALIGFGLARLAPRDPRAARDAFESWRRAGMLDDASAAATAPRIANALTTLSNEEAARWIIGLDAGARSGALAEDAVRYALRTGDWTLVSAAVRLLPPDLAQVQRWRYWRTRADETGAPAGDAAVALAYRDVSATRSYYGFLAADRIGLKPDMQYQPVPVDDVLMREAERFPPIARSRERFLLGETGAAWREWRHALKIMDKRQRQAAARVATAWGWHQQAIFALIAAEDVNDLKLRFPVLFPTTFSSAARRQNVEPHWLFAIARQESMFNPVIKSPAGAVGLMQLMPATAQQTARNAGIPYRGVLDLQNPDTNVALGSRYMRLMLDDFQQNRILAAAAYNAGPHRVRQWLRRLPPQVDHDMFVETIPFLETRNYVQNVLSFAVIYAWLQGREVPLVQPGEAVIRNPFYNAR